VHGWGPYYIRQYILYNQLHNHIVTKFRLNEMSGCVTGGAGVLGVLGSAGTTEDSSTQVSLLLKY
jgi:hypothetical protein